MKITPSWVHTFETNLQTLIQDAWARRRAKLVYDLFVDKRSSTAGRELIFWLLETARIHREGKGGNKRYDDIAAQYFEIVNEDSGNGLILTKNEINDNQMAGALKGMPTLDYAANWARQMGGAAACWPEDEFFSLIFSGETKLAYDGVPFFSAAHPINPLAGAGSPTYPNLLTGATYAIDATAAATVDIAAANFARAVAVIETLTQPNGQPRNLKVRHALFGPNLRKRGTEVLASKYLTLNNIDNVVSQYGIEPVISAKITSATGYYLACEIIPGEGGPVIYQEREPYVLSSYLPASTAELQRRKEFEWSFDGRNAIAFGHPYLLFNVKPS